MTSSPPLISVIIPSYNYARFLPRAIDSTLGQDYPNVEIIVIDDGSVDETATVAASYADQIQYYYQENRGLAGARNTGIEKSSGSLLFFLDADDEMKPDALSQFYLAMTSLEKETALVGCLAEVVQWRNTVPHYPELNPIPINPDPEKITWRQLLFGARFPCTVLCRREVFDECGGFDETYRHQGCEDRDMWLRLACAHSIYRLPMRLVTLHHHSSNMSSEPNRQLAGIRKLQRKARDMGQVSRWRLAFWASLSSSYHYTASLLYEEARDYKASLGHAVLALMIFPLPGLRQYLRRPHLFRVTRIASAAKKWIHSSGFSPTGHSPDLP